MTTATGTDAAEAKRPRHSLIMTNRQLAVAVKYGRRVTFYCPDLDNDVIGYVMGFDDDNVLIAVPQEGGGIDTPIRHRDYIAGIDIDRNFNMSDEPEPLPGELEDMVRNFRTYVMNAYFQRDPNR